MTGPTTKLRVVQSFVCHLCAFIFCFVELRRQVFLLNFLLGFPWEGWSPPLVECSLSVAGPPDYVFVCVLGFDEMLWRAQQAISQADEYGILYGTCMGCWVYSVRIVREQHNSAFVVHNRYINKFITDMVREKC